LASAVTIEAAWAIDAGPADSALAVGSPELAALDDAKDALPFAALVSVAALLQAADAAIAAPAASHADTLEIFMSPSSCLGRTSALPQFNGHAHWVARVDLSGTLCHLRGMTVARISELDRRTTQSGKANSGGWLLEFEREQPLRPDPLTGWNGSGDTNPQVRMNFPTSDAAITYCEKHGLDYHVVPAPPVRLKLQAYADNFR
jgi:hypothetical protein